MIMDRVSVHLDEIADLIAANSGEDIAELLVDHIDYENLPVNYDEFIIDYEEFAKEVDHSDIAYELAYSHIGAAEVAEHLAGEIDATEVAEYISLGDLACEIDISDLAESFSDSRMKQVADSVSCAELAKHVQDPWSMMVTPFQENKEA